jgi:3-phenylpropionate/cinnamic acid dioxygenase small subunit
MNHPAQLITLGEASAAACVDGVCHPTKPVTPISPEETMSTIVSTELRFEILDLVYRYATGIDSRDWDLFRSVFSDDADVDFGFSRWSGGDAFTAFMREAHDPAGRTLHRMSNTVITGAEPLAARTYGDALVLEADNVNGTIANAWYDDVFVRTGAHGLQIRSRTVRMASMIKVGPSLAAAM